MDAANVSGITFLVPLMIILYVNVTAVTRQKWSKLISDEERI